MTDSKSIPASRTLSESHRHQIQVLKSFDSAKREELAAGKSHFEISEIAQRSGLDDEKEVQRYLLILEGQKLVCPFPEGDFTSSKWQITNAGQRAIKKISTAIRM